MRARACVCVCVWEGRSDQLGDAREVGSCEPVRVMCTCVFICMDLNVYLCGKCIFSVRVSRRVHEEIFLITTVSLKPLGTLK